MRADSDRLKYLPIAGDKSPGCKSSESQRSPTRIDSEAIHINELLRACPNEKTGPHLQAG